MDDAILKDAIRLKQNIWKVTLDENVYFAKKLRRAEDAKRVCYIHEQLQQQGFHAIIPIKSVEQKTIILQDWQRKSRSANFSSLVDRSAAMQLLTKLHDVGKQIEWTEMTRPPLAKSYLKWQLRFNRFQQCFEALAYYLPKHTLRQLVDYAERALRDVYSAEYGVKPEPITLLHGDVVHHNFLVRADGQMCLIDFDLAQLGEADDELILWMHRVLPNMQYHLRALMTEQYALQKITNEKLHRLKYPNELLREWLYVLTLDTEDKEQFLQYLHPFTQSALYFWPELWETSEKLATNTWK